MSPVWDFWHQIQAIVASWDIVTMTLAALVILAAGLAIRGLAALPGVTLAALIGFAAALFVKALLEGAADAGALAQTQWHDFLAMPMMVLLSYAVCFAVLIAILYAIRKLVTD
jgi:hypothetical protein